jgi:uncharacterized iron-regulated membrane protein
MAFFQQWLRQPQSTWLRKALFQIHLWGGLILGLYIVAVCVSGSAIVFRNEVYDILQKRLKVTPSGEALPREKLEQALQRTHPGYTISDITKGRDEEEAWEIRLRLQTGSEIVRLVDPYTGEDRGGPVSGWFRLFRWLGELHGKLLWQDGGYVANGIGGLLMCVVCATGLFVWWPGIGRIKRAITFRFGAGWKRFNFDLHSAIGFWTFALLFMWAFTGAYFVFPDPVRATVNFFTPINPPRVAQQSPRSGQTDIRPLLPQSGAAQPATSAQPPGSGQSATPQTGVPPLRRPRRPLTLGGKILRGFSNAHYGTFGGWQVKALWVMLGLAPAVLFATAVAMWWNRALKPWIWRRQRRAAETELVRATEEITR